MQPRDHQALGRFSSLAAPRGACLARAGTASLMTSNLVLLLPSACSLASILLVSFLKVPRVITNLFIHALRSSFSSCLSHLPLRPLRNFAP